MASKLEGIGLTSLDDLFKTGEERQAEQGEQDQKLHIAIAISNGMC